jgi:hypothetical protein
MASRPPNDIAEYLKRNSTPLVNLDANNPFKSDLIAPYTPSKINSGPLVDLNNISTDLSQRRSIISGPLVDLNNMSTDLQLQETGIISGPLVDNPTSDLSELQQTIPTLPSAQPNDDLHDRFRISSLAGNEENVYGENDRNTNLLAVFHDTAGLMFPYTPTVSFNQPVSWQSMELMNTNYDILSYNRTPSPTISLTGKFTCQNAGEARYSLAVIHFMRVLSKGGFGKQDAVDGVAGLPPRVVRLNGYGRHMFNNLRCIIRGHSWSFDENIDTVQVNFDGEYARLPMVFSITFELGIVVSPKTQREKFSSSEFRTGKLIYKNDFGFI